MKRALTALALSAALLLCSVRPAYASVTMVLDGIITDTDSAAVDTLNKKSIRAQVWSSAGSTSVVLIQVKSTSAAPWYTVATVTNADASGEYWSIPRAAQARASATVAAGTVYVVIEVYTD